MSDDIKLPSDPGVEKARAAAPSPGRTRPAPLQADHETASDAAGERTREEHPPDRPGTVTPAPPRSAGADVNDVDRLEDATDRFLGGGEASSPRR